MALFPKDEAAQLVPQVLDLLRVTGGAEPFGQIEKFPFLPLAGLDALLDQFHQNTVIAETPLLRYRPTFRATSGGSVTLRRTSRSDARLVTVIESLNTILVHRYYFTLPPLLRHPRGSGAPPTLLIPWPICSPWMRPASRATSSVSGCTATA